MKKTKNRLLSFVIAVVLATGMFIAMPVVVSATDGTLSLVRVTAPEAIFPGSVVTLDIVITGNPGFGSLQYKIEYDSPYVTDWTRQDMDFPVTLLEWTHRLENGQRTQFMTAEERNETRNGIMSRYALKICETAPVGTIIPFTFEKEHSLGAVSLQPIDINVVGESTNLTLTEAPNFNVSARFRAIMARGFVLGDITGDGIFDTTDVLVTRQLANPGHVRTVASTAAQFPQHDVAYVYSVLRDIQNSPNGLPNVFSIRFGNIVSRGLVFGDITGDGVFDTTDVLVTRQLANPGHVRTVASTFTQFPNHEEAYLFNVVRGILGIM